MSSFTPREGEPWPNRLPIGGERWDDGPPMQRLKSAGEVASVPAAETPKLDPVPTRVAPRRLGSNVDRTTHQPVRQGFPAIIHPKSETVDVLSPSAPKVDPNEEAIRLRERAQFLRQLVDVYYPTSAPGLQVVEGKLDLRKLGKLGRVDEIGSLKRVALAVPYALGGEWFFSPLAKSKGFDFDLDKALEQHAAYTRILLERGVKVSLMLQPEGASEAVYATDTLTAIGKTVLIGNPKHEARRLEIDKFKGGVRLDQFGGRDAPIEFGDVLLAHDGQRQHVIQAYQSWRSTEASVEAMRAALKYLQSRQLIDPFELHPVRLSGEDTLHIDYVTNYAGEGQQRRMPLYEPGIADPAAIDDLMRALGVSDKQIIPISYAEMLAGAGNIESIDPRTVSVIDNEGTQRVIGLLQAAGLEVIHPTFDQMSQKDGTVHCVTGQLLRQS